MPFAEPTCENSLVDNFVFYILSIFCPKLVCSDVTKREFLEKKCDLYDNCMNDVKLTRD